MKVKTIGSSTTSCNLCTKSCILYFIYPLKFVFQSASFSKQTSYTECKYGGPLGRRPGRVMKVRLVRPRCFVFTMLPLKSLAEAEKIESQITSST